MALYHRDGDHFVPTPLTIGPWDPRLQHGGPPSGLLTRALESLGDDPTYALCRVTVDLLRPVPLVPLRVHATPTRQGRRAWWLQAELRDADERLLARATALRVRRTEGLDAPGARPAPPPPLPDDVTPFTFPFFPADPAFHRAVELRLVGGTWPTSPIEAWVRLVEPLVEGEDPSPWQRMMTVCDALNGVAPAIASPGWSFVNADLDVVARRAPAGPDVGFRAHSLPGDDGAGLARATLFDRHGEIGHVCETLVVDRVAGRTPMDAMEG